MRNVPNAPQKTPNQKMLCPFFFRYAVPILKGVGKRAVVTRIMTAARIAHLILRDQTPLQMNRIT